jgi:hypothetical protein
MERKLYRITRGSLSRRDGKTIIPVDDKGEKISGAKARPAFVHYAAKTMANPAAIDEVLLTDTEARAFGLSRLQRILRRNNTVIEEAPAAEAVEADESDDDFSSRVHELLEASERVTGMAETAEFRRKVEIAGVLADVPKRKADIITALRQLSN